MTVAIIWGFFMSTIVYISGLLSEKTHRMSGNFFYDYFMGSCLNPRIGQVDLKMWAEIRIPWPVLFYLSLSCLLKQYETYGTVTAPAVFMVLAHFLYVNACQKGEECIPTSWDIFYEKNGNIQKKSSCLVSITCLCLYRIYVDFLEYGWCTIYLLLFIHLPYEISIDYRPCHYTQYNLYCELVHYTARGLLHI